MQNSAAILNPPVVPSPDNFILDHQHRTVEIGLRGEKIGGSAADRCAAYDHYIKFRVHLKPGCLAARASAIRHHKHVGKGLMRSLPGIFETPVAAARIRLHG